MKLRHKALLIVGATLLGLNLGLFLIMSTILKRSFQMVENKRVEELMARTAISLEQIADQFNARFADWASWDDTAAFVQGQMPDYAAINLDQAALSLVQADLVAVVNRKADLVYGAELDPVTQEMLPLPDAFRAVLASGHPLVTHNRIDSSVSGFLLLPEGIVLLSSRPILTNESEGPIRGTMIFGRYIDPQELGRLSNTIGLPLWIAPLQTITSTTKPALTQALQYPGAIATQILDESTIAGYTLLNDIEGQAAVVAQITLPRTIYAQYRLTVTYLIGAILVLDLAVAIATLLLLERLVISRVTQLSQDVGQIHISEGQLSDRVSVMGRDELAGLGIAINRMLEAIEVYERDRQQTQIVLEQARSDAESASRAKSQFLANMSHELRTPLTAILGYSEILALELHNLGHGPLSDDMHKIERAGHHLLRLIKDMLDFSRLETNALSFHIKPFPLSELVQEISHKATIWAAQNDNQLIVNGPATLGLMESDRERLRQCLFNVLNNACKFTHEGTITLTVDYRDTGATRPPTSPNPPVSASGASPPSGATVTFSISDTGIGIAPEQLQRIFEPFTQGDETSTRRYGGTGLGLAISQRLCDALGGDITVESQPGKGTTFTLRFPVVAPSTLSGALALAH